MEPAFLFSRAVSRIGGSSVRPSPERAGGIAYRKPHHTQQQRDGPDGKLNKVSI
ncbi:MAG: hypothetical protein JKP90_11870 [Desulfofustis sp. PB-SRB1]|nr:hypothetical protein [Desulfofustis sp. PB-SRB1]